MSTLTFVFIVFCLYLLSKIVAKVLAVAQHNVLWPQGNCDHREMSVVCPSASSTLAVVFIQVVCLGCSGGSRRQYIHADEGLHVCGVWALCICRVLGQQVLFETRHPPPSHSIHIDSKCKWLVGRTSGTALKLNLQFKSQFSLPISDFCT